MIILPVKYNSQQLNNISVTELKRIFPLLEKNLLEELQLYIFCRLKKHVFALGYRYTYLITSLLYLILCFKIVIFLVLTQRNSLT